MMETGLAPRTSMALSSRKKSKEVYPLSLYPSFSLPSIGGLEGIGVNKGWKGGS